MIRPPHAGRQDRKGVRTFSPGGDRMKFIFWGFRFFPMTRIHIHFGSPSRTPLELSPSQGLLRAIIQLTLPFFKDGGQMCQACAIYKGPVLPQRPGSLSLF